MSHQVLARKWRPARFTEMVGQEHVLQALVNALDSDRLHHAYLFTGTRGVGKTTIARIFARCLNCDQGVTSTPCGECSACQEITQGNFVDLIEVDAASRTKIEDTRELLENVQYAPTRGRYKVYLIDEVHMLSNHSFNALLKTLEEPPPHVKFLLATTDPQKLPATILSRCLQFNLKNLSAERIVEHLGHVLREEAVASDEAALWLLADAARGSMRDALSLTDQGIAFGAGGLVENDVRTMLGTIDRQAVQRVLTAIIGGDAQALLDEVEKLASFGTDFQALLEDLQGLLHAIAVSQVLPGSTTSRSDNAEGEQFASTLAAEDVQVYYQIALNGRRDFPYMPDPRRGFEMIALRMLAFRPTEASSLQVVAQAQGGGAPAVKKPEGRPAPEKAAKPSSSSSAQAQAVVTPAADKAPAAKAIEQQAPAPPPEASPAAEAQPTPSPATEALAPAASPDFALAEKPQVQDLTAPLWCRLLNHLALRGVVRNIASNCALFSAEQGLVSFVLDDEQATLYSPEHQGRIEKALQDYFDCPLQVSIQVGAVPAETPAAYTRRKQSERLDKALASLQADPNVQMLAEEFGGELVVSTVRPIDH